MSIDRGQIGQKNELVRKLTSLPVLECVLDVAPRKVKRGRVRSILITRTKVDIALLKSVQPFPFEVLGEVGQRKERAQTDKDGDNTLCVMSAE